MQNIPSSLVYTIISSSNIVSIISEFISLQKRGNNYIGICPFHADKTPSLSVSEVKNIYKCFSCGHSGNVVNFVKEFKKISYLNTLKFLAQRANLNINFNDFTSEEQIKHSLEDSKNLELLDLANSYFKLNITNDEAQKFLFKRYLNKSEILEKFDIGFAPFKNYLDILKTDNLYSEINLNEVGLINEDLNLIFKNRIIFGIRNMYGEIVAFSARQINEDKNFPKYINSPETKYFKKSEILYNFYNAKDFAFFSKEIIIVEGFMDVIALWKAQHQNVIALMGTTLTNYHLKLLKGLKIILFLDNDLAGMNATFNLALKLLENKFEVEIINNTFDKDPDEIYNHYGKDMLDNIVKQNRKLSEHLVFEQLLKQNFLTEENFDKTSVNFFNFKKALTNLLYNCSRKSAEILEQRFFKSFNEYLILKKFQTQNLFLGSKKSFKQENKFKNIIYNDIRLEILLVCLSNYKLRDLMQKDSKQYYKNQQIINNFSIFSDFGFNSLLKDKLKINYKEIFEEILNLNNNIQYHYAEDNPEIIILILEKIKNELKHFYNNITETELQQQIDEYFAKKDHQIKSINEQNFKNNYYLKILSNKFYHTLNYELREFIKQNSIENQIPPIITEYTKMLKEINKLKEK